MKKSTLWLIVVVMVVAFVGLLFMQVKYIDATYQARRFQFDSSVRQALFETNHDLERDEMIDIIRVDLGLPGYVVRDFLIRPTEGSKSPFDLGTAGQGLPDYKLEQLPQPPKKSYDFVTPGDRFREAERMLRSHFAEPDSVTQRILLQVALEGLRKAQYRPIYDRIDGQHLEEYLLESLDKYGITIPFRYEVVDSRGTISFSNGSLPVDQPDKIYTQALLTNDPPSRLHYLRVYFPGQARFISSTIGFLIPSVIFSILVLATFIYTIITLFRQKKIDEMRIDFVNNMTHELKTPVSTIRLGVEMLSDPDIGSQSDRRARILESINAEAYRLTLLIEQVLQMSFFDSHDSRLRLRMTELDMEEIIIDATSTYSLKVEEAGGSLDLDLEATRTEVLGDKLQLTNIIFNLLDNAMKYRRPDVPPHITVHTASNDRNLTIRVEDNGCGIKREYLKKIFDRFFRVPSGNRHDVKGFGLGLPYVALTVKSHGGHIHAESDLGVGTTFIITLPLLTGKSKSNNNVRSK